MAATVVSKKAQIKQLRTQLKLASKVFDKYTKVTPKKYLAFVAAGEQFLDVAKRYYKVKK